MGVGCAPSWRSLSRTDRFEWLAQRKCGEREREGQGETLASSYVEEMERDRTAIGH